MSTAQATLSITWTFTQASFATSHPSLPQQAAQNTAVRTTGGRPCRACCCGCPRSQRAPWLRRWLRFNHRSEDLYSAQGQQLITKLACKQDTSFLTIPHLQARRRLVRGGERGLAATAQPFFSLVRVLALTHVRLTERINCKRLRHSRKSHTLPSIR